MMYRSDQALKAQIKKLSLYICESVNDFSTSFQPPIWLDNYQHVNPQFTLIQCDALFFENSADIGLHFSKSI